MRNWPSILESSTPLHRYRTYVIFFRKYCMLTSFLIIPDRWVQGEKIVCHRPTGTLSFSRRRIRKFSFQGSGTTPRFEQANRDGVRVRLRHELPVNRHDLRPFRQSQSVKDLKKDFLVVLGES